MKNPNGTLGLKILTAYISIAAIVIFYVGNAVTSDVTGDYAVYTKMYEVSSWPSFINQPLFTLYFELVKLVSWNASVFFINLLFFPLMIFLRIYFPRVLITNIAFITATITIFFWKVLSPEMLVYLLRQNLGVLTFLILVQRNSIIAFVAAVLFHYSLAPIIGIAYLIKLTLVKFTTGGRLVSIFITINIVLFVLSPYVADYFFQLGGSVNPVINNFIITYQNYNEDFPDFSALFGYGFLVIILHAYYGDKRKKQLGWPFALCLAAVVLAAAASFSDAITYRTLQTLKLPSLILLLQLSGNIKLRCWKLSFNEKRENSL
jgi:hypothetical protein